jgi:uncharacterized membrane protein YfcA
VFALLLLCLFAFAAGFVDAVVGGGGLIQLPAMFLLQPQLSLAQTLATNKTASFCGTALSAWHYLKAVPLRWRSLLPGVIAAATGAVAGAALVSLFKKEAFLPVILAALVAVFIYTLLRKDFGIHRGKSLSPGRHGVLLFLIGAAIGFYDGLIGPGTGSFLVFAFVALFGYSFVQAAASGKVLNCVTNAAALVIFIAKGAVVWSLALPVAAANMLGNYAGTKLALRKGNGFVRIFFLCIVSALILKLGWDYLHT